MYGFVGNGPVDIWDFVGMHSDIDYSTPILDWFFVFNMDSLSSSLGSGNCTDFSKINGDLDDHYLPVDREEYWSTYEMPSRNQLMLAANQFKLTQAVDKARDMMNLFDDLSPEQWGCGVSDDSEKCNGYRANIEQYASEAKSHLNNAKSYFSFTQEFIRTLAEGTFGVSLGGEGATDEFHQNWTMIGHPGQTHLRTGVSWMNDYFKSRKQAYEELGKFVSECFCDCEWVTCL